jgi:hypothetical protein
MRVRVVSLLLLLAARPATAQSWNDAATRALVQRGISRRATDAAAGLEDFRATAHGFVFFLAQIGEEGLTQPPKLVKADQLEVEVYWKAPGHSKQRIIGWRDRVELPTDIQYHRDHLGIVMNGFGDRIRLGEGDEVRDVPHPLAPDGPSLYDYAIRDSVVIRTLDREIRAIEVAFRPRTFDAPRIVGSMVLDAASGQLVRMAFSFTRASYRDATLEDITVQLENGLREEKYWLPRQQEIEIRRRTSWMDVPARGIIRGRWEIGDYHFDVGLAPRTFLGPSIEVAPEARDSFPWTEPLDQAVQAELGPKLALRMDDVRAAARSVAGVRSLSGLPTHGPSISSFSEVLHANRVEGPTIGMGYVFRPGGGPLTVRARAGYGFTGRHPTGGMELAYTTPTWQANVTGGRTIRDVGDVPTISGVLNSFLSQELGHDYGDYVLLDEVRISGGSEAVEVRGAYQHTESLATVGAPVAGTYAPNPPLGSGNWWVGGLTLRGRTGGIVGGFANGTLDAEGGVGGGGRSYVRLHGSAQTEHRVGPGRLSVAVEGGWGSPNLPPYRGFVFGGRGTLPGEPYRAYGGRAVALGRVGWEVALPAPVIPLGRYASTGRQVVAGPFVAAGWGGKPFVNLPWGTSDGVRPVLGLSADVFNQLLRVEFGWGLRDGGVGVTVDVRRDLWSIL